MCGIVGSISNQIISEKELSKHNFFNQDAIQIKIDNHSKGRYDHNQQLWALLIFQSWYRKYME